MTTPAHPSVVLLHSSTGSARQWAGLRDRLAPHFEVRAVEFHGHGATPGWAGERPMTLADEAALAAPLLAAPGGAHLVGHSYGAAVALKLATLYPQAVRSVVVYEPVLFHWLIEDDPHAAAAREIVAVAAAIRDGVARDALPAAAVHFIDYWSGPGTWAALPSGRREGIALRMAAVQAHFEALIAEPLRGSELARLKMPMLCLSGAGTAAATRRIAGLLRRALPQARHERLLGMGHMGPVTHADAVNARIEAFLEGAVHGGEGRARPKADGRAALSSAQPVALRVLPQERPDNGPDAVHERFRAASAGSSWTVNAGGWPLRCCCPC